jgi:hypothetical protein
VNTNISWAPYQYPSNPSGNFSTKRTQKCAKINTIIVCVRFTSFRTKLIDEIASNQPTSTEASELQALPVSILEVSGSIIHLDTGNPNMCYAIFSVSQLTPGPFHTLPIIHSHHHSRVTLKHIQLQNS